ncbi:hypothetical protein [Amycolatopsis sp. DG1A-15b]|uniref:hypothetical protein n=1 Tax=Amycolatopsis sp. DG1A-15b TaxID=3052846 RepID=UPI00255B5DFF|nr:hypothetical protein [Amycolatopsis sp. DG1A-15b]WIX85836.1 hypothetical protein QRY02_32120 [Amycolatopsis sp. DG1A-15b]
MNANTTATSDARTIELDFRANAPRQLDHIEIIEITRFDGGNRRRYAAAAALTRTDGVYSTHTLVFQDDRNRYVVRDGHYDIPTRAEAEADARVRPLV